MSGLQNKLHYFGDKSAIIQPRQVKIIEPLTPRELMTYQALEIILPRLLFISRWLWRQHPDRWP
ncbi:hypothetical protein Cflav_PD5894 [Pedosphaera parvula Ellin514]|uniref:Uncharacterized protein n=1 Tax=Pedosphaera parvula (strain Ellin514) TaxID=320771 RepID=B9X9L5_PEDPL|nr:hypothetical protein Cflav_PD5894 [Pedosphaera parvula Ellin514]